VSAARVIGVLGAGTMGAGIAQLAARSGARTILHDPLPEALARGAQYARDGLGKEAAKGRLSAAEADAAAARIEPVGDLAAFASCELVIEAAPERLELKHELYKRLSEEIVGEECVLATNTSSLLVTAIAAAASKPERVVGMHFFNPAPVMRLLEVVAGVESSAEALALATATGEAMGKTVIRAKDGPGFIVNRCNRPFGLEALRTLQEQIADVETIDRIVRQEGGFRMGPFELMDLVGVDTGFEISKSFYEQSFYEPRWQPSQITARYVAAGLYGRKTGRGYYDYSRDPYRPADPDPQGAEEEVQPAAGGVLSRIVCQVINECAFALGEGVGSAADIDTGMVLGLNYPRGPLAWADQIGLDHVLAVLDGLWEEYHEERYRSAPELKRLVRAGRLGRSTGAGFFSYQEA
jgi:3-hydroxybutyryl-CoA dehydrogenase